MSKQCHQQLVFIWKVNKLFSSVIGIPSLQTFQGKLSQMKVAFSDLGSPTVLQDYYNLVSTQIESSRVRTCILTLKLTSIQVLVGMLVEINFLRNSKSQYLLKLFYLALQIMPLNNRSIFKQSYGKNHACCCQQGWPRDLSIGRKSQRLAVAFFVNPVCVTCKLFITYLT